MSKHARNLYLEYLDICTVWDVSHACEKGGPYQQHQATKHVLISHVHYTFGSGFRLTPGDRYDRSTTLLGLPEDGGRTPVAWKKFPGRCHSGY